MGGFFYQLGRLAGPSVRKGKWLWKSLTGSDDELLQAEEEVGADLDRAFLAGVSLDPESELQELAAALTGKLAQKVKNKKRKFRPRVLASEAVNAFALPGGYIYLTRGLVECVERSSDELAFVIAHEMGHVIRQDPMQRVVTEAAVGAALKLLARKGPASYLRSVGAKLLQSAYSQDRELGADELAVRLLRASGFPPQAAVALLEKLSARAKDTSLQATLLGPYFSTHPPFELRIRRIRRMLKA